MTHKLAVIEHDNFKYIFKSRSQHRGFQTWRCSFKPSCKATITLNHDGDVVQATNDHNHDALGDQQIRGTSLYEMEIYKKFKRVTSFCENSENVIEGPGNNSPKSENGSKEGNAEEQEATFPKLGTPFSMAGHNSLMLINSTIQKQPKVDELLEQRNYIVGGTKSGCIEKQDILAFNPAIRLVKHEEKSSKFGVGELHPQQFQADRQGNRSLVRNPKSTVIHNFSVVKSTRTMQNILAQALHRLNGVERVEEQVPTAPSKRSRDQRYENTEHKEESDVEALMEAEWQKQFMKEEPGEEEEDDREIKVDISEEDEQDSCIDEDEMATILGD